MASLTSSVELILTDHFPYRIRKVLKGALKTNQTETAEILVLWYHGNTSQYAAKKTKIKTRGGAKTGFKVEPCSVNRLDHLGVLEMNRV